MDTLNQFLEHSESSDLKIAVVGDSLIDEYYSVKVNRVSPEFPIPVLLSEDDKPISVVPGGAANVCYQMKYWNCKVNLLTAMTKSSEDIIVSNNFDCRYSVTMNNGWKMPKKKRFYDGDFPLDRWDVEAKNTAKTNTPEWSTARKQLLENFSKMLFEFKPDIVILSDYGKGVFLNGKEKISDKIISQCNEKQIPVIVDPKTVNVDYWKGCTVIKPNAEWAKAFCEKYSPEFDFGVSQWKNEMKFISDYLKCPNVVLTDSGNGVGIYTQEESTFLPSPELSKKRPIIRSVIGAGDCFCAFFSIAKALSISIKEAVEIAFNGASSYIEDKHNTPVTPYKFQKWFNPIGAKIVSLNKLLTIKSQLPNQKWVWTNGCFDILHSGHLKTFKEAKKLGDKLIVGINTDESIKKLKGPERPILPYQQREELISNLELVDFVIPINEETPEKIIQMLKPDKIVKGGDYKVENISGANTVGKENVHLVNLYPDISTSKIIEKVKNG